MAIVKKKKKLDVVVLGAGVGGLMTGAWLVARGHRVTVLEKATTVGGSAGWYVRRGRMVPAGATILFGLEPGGLLRGLLEEAGVDVQAETLGATKLTYPMDVVLSDRTVRIWQEREAWEAELRRVFVERGEAVVRFWRALERLADAVHGFSAARVALPLRGWRELAGLARFVWRRPLEAGRLVAYAPWTVHGLLRAHRLADYAPLRELLDAQLYDAAQTDARHAALLPASLALDVYRRGSFATTPGALARALAQRIDAADGGTVVTATTVTDTRYDAATRRWHVATSRAGASYTCDAVIDNTGRHFQPSPGDASTDYWGAFRLDATLHASALAIERLPFAYQLTATGHDFHGPIYATFHQALDAQGSPIADEILLTVSVHTDPYSWTTLDRDAYNARKLALQTSILTHLRNTVLPNLDEHLIHIDAGTPRTYLKYIGKQAVGGAPMTLTHSILRPTTFYAQQPSYFYAGEHVFPGPGTLSAAISGYFAARALDRRT
jgi:phytoene dehydrogenase-like protein